MKEAVGQRTLEETPARVFEFLRGLHRNAAIRKTLAEKGFDDPALQEGWVLVLKVAGYKAPAEVEVIEDDEANVAQRDLERWLSEALRVLRATLSRHFPDQGDFVLDGLTAADGFEAVATVATLLDRLDALESSPDRAATRDDDKRALELLAKRVLPSSERQRLRALVDKVIRAKNLPAAPPPSVSTSKKEAQHLEDLKALRAWYEEWSEIARAVISRRDWLILLGLARRKRSKGEPPQS